MTLILALTSPQGIVLASDSASTAETFIQETHLATKKIFELDNRILAAGSGMDCVTCAVRSRFEELAKANQLRGNSLKEIQARVAKGAHEAAKAARDLWLPPLGDEKRDPPVGEFVVCGYHAENPWVLEIHRNGTVAPREQEGFTAIGSGDTFAYFSVANWRRWGIKMDKLDHAALVAFSLLDDAIHAAPRWLRGPVQIWTMAKPVSSTAAPMIEELSKAKIDALGTAYATWRAAQIESLPGLFDAQPAPAISVPQ